MTPQPNIAGIYTDATEHIRYDERNGARVEVMLVECADGWRWGYGFWAEARILCSRPNVDRRPLPTRQQAIDSALEFVRGLADELASDASAEPTARTPTAQMELFA